MYEVHLQTVHPSKNAEDLSPLGQVKITSVFQATAKPKIVNVVDQEEVGLDESVHDETGSSSRKRRHESGESVESGYFEADQAGSSEEKKIIDDGRDYLTLKTLDH